MVSAVCVGMGEGPCGKGLLCHREKWLEVWSSKAQNGDRRNWPILNKTLGSVR